jgi:hypothetical protein
VGARNAAHDCGLRVHPGTRLGMIRLVTLRLTYLITSGLLGRMVLLALWVPEIRPPTVTCGFVTHPGSA